MSLQPIDTTPIFLKSLVSAGIVGPNSIQLAEGLANGLSLSSQNAYRVTSIDSGTLGSGIGTGKALFQPIPFLKAASEIFPGYMMAGMYAPNLIGAIADALTMIIPLSLINTIHPSVGTGFGKGTMVGTSGFGFWLVGLSQAGLIGEQGIKLASAVADSFEAGMTGIDISIIISGPPSNSPSTGIGFGSIT